MKIIVDAFGGDNAPLEIIKGSADAVKEYGVEILLVGSEKIIKETANENNISLDNMEIMDVEKVFLMEYDPATIIKQNNDTTMAMGLKALADNQGDAFVSAGSTGALVVGATFITKRIKGIKRGALATLMPSTEKPIMMLDVGANTECKPEYLHQFAVMGDIYMNKIMGYDSPRVALANIGTESNKGTDLQLESYKLMSEAKYNFTGNIEARDIPFGKADVIVCDGFTGNMILKMYEGVALAMAKRVKGLFKRNFLSLIAALLVKSGIDDFKKQMDYKEFGGAPILGISKPVIKAHGSSDAKSFKNAIRQAISFVEKDVINEIITNIK
ncbi:MAG: phosphate acyltransferase PlsX [Clostridia bacterium]|nr:phosphate acyltransferase PlsX [Clostridia bacterium]MBQ6708787.1 phosphate acyltransferase PlsX [Clostridia bacterium]